MSRPIRSDARFDCFPEAETSQQVYVSGLIATYAVTGVLRKNIWRRDRTTA